MFKSAALSNLIQAYQPFIAVRLSNKAKRLTLRVDNTTRKINFIIPERMRMHRALEFLEAHEDWIVDKIDQFPDPIQYKHGTKIPLFGNKNTLYITYDKTLKRTDISLKNKEIIVFTNQENPHSRIERFFKKEIKEEITTLATEKAEIIGKKINRISVRDTKTRWGSCSPDGSLSFSWRLIFAPYSALDYLVAHEVAHLKYMNHSKNFWALCERLSEEYSEGKNWIKTHGNSLMRYGQKAE